MFILDPNPFTFCSVSFFKLGIENVALHDKMPFLNQHLSGIPISFRHLLDSYGGVT